MYLTRISENSLSGIGKLLSKRPENGNLTEEYLELRAEDEIQRYCCQKPVVLDYDKGMTVLAVYGAEKITCFYLDRMVEIVSGVSFSVFPLEGDGSVVLLRPSAAPLEKTATFFPPDMLHEAPPFSLQKIYTVFYQEISENFYFRGESHAPFELVYVNQGTLHNIMNGHDHVLHQGECVLVDSNQWHMQYSDRPVKFLTVSFRHTGALSGNLTDKVLHLSDDERALLTKILGEPMNRPMASEYIEALLQQLLIELLRTPGTDKSTAKAPGTSFFENTLVDSALKWISENISQKIVLSDIAKALHISVPYLYKLFDAHLHMPPGRYIMKIRLEESKVLLREGQKTVGEIAKECGFSSCQHFSRQFHQHTGAAPTEYVRSLR